MIRYIYKTDYYLFQWFQW